MDATSAWFSVSVLLLVGVYGIYWLESRRGVDVSRDPGTAKERHSADPAA